MEYTEFKDGNVLADGKWRSIRELMSELDEEEFAHLSEKREIDHFIKSTKFCGFCGAATVQAEDQEVRYARKCPNENCQGNKSFLYPSYSIATITIVSRNEGNEILLGHNMAWPHGRVSLLAGFMQPGENLEDCVRREVYEESGIRLLSLKYIKSQTWPFPSNIMAGFYAEAADGEARPDGKELDRVYWKDREELVRIMEGKSETGLFLPKKGSLAFRLISMWISRKI